MSAQAPEQSRAGVRDGVVVMVLWVTTVLAARALVLMLAASAFPVSFPKLI